MIRLKFEHNGFDECNNFSKGSYKHNKDAHASII